MPGNHLIPTLLLCAAVITVAPWANAATISVNSTLDQLEPSGVCTLREAIQAANTNLPVSGCSAGSAAETDQIIFNYPDPEDHTIDLVDELPQITQPVVIDGISNTLGSCPFNPGVTIVGRGQTRTFDFQPGSDGSLVKGMRIYGHWLCLTFYCEDREAIRVVGAHDIKIQCNVLGIDENNSINNDNWNWTDIEAFDGATGLIIGADGDGIDDDLEANQLEGRVTTELYDVFATEIRGNRFHEQFKQGWDLDIRGAGDLQIGMDPAAPDPSHGNTFSGIVGVDIWDADGPVGIFGNTFGLDSHGNLTNLALGVRVRSGTDIQVGSSWQGGFALGNSFHMNGFFNSHVVVYVPEYLNLFDVGMTLEGNALIGNADQDLPTQKVWGVRVENEFANVTLKDNLIINMDEAVAGRFGWTGSPQGGNCIEGNQLAANQFWQGTLALPNNWWGSSDGPSGAGQGTGDPVSDGVQFEPFLVAPPPSCLMLGGAGAVFPIPILSAKATVMLLLLVLLLGLRVLSMNSGKSVRYPRR